MDELIDLLSTNKGVFLSLIAVFSLLVGSFLNVVRVRMPVMLSKLWHTECYQLLGITNNPDIEAINSSIEQQHPENIDPNINCSHNVEATFNLITPRSCCPNCKHSIAWFDNIPLLSFILLGGKCRHCKQKISLHYPAVELTTAICSLVVANHFEFSIQTTLALVFTWVLIVQSWIDIEHTFLPDDITLSCLWLGLIANCFYIFVDPVSAILGAVFGYISLYLIYWVFKLLTGKEGMGYGDFKLLAMIGAWLGWEQLACIIFISSLCGAVVGIVLILYKQKSLSSKIPFGPYIAAAGWLSLLWGNSLCLFG